MHDSRNGSRRRPLTPPSPHPLPACGERERGRSAAPRARYAFICHNCGALLRAIDRCAVGSHARSESQSMRHAMSLDADHIVDRRRMRRKLTFWRVLAVAIVIAAVAAVAIWRTPRFAGVPGTDRIARVTIS